MAMKQVSLGLPSAIELAQLALGWGGDTLTVRAVWILCAILGKRAIASQSVADGRIVVAK